MESFLWIRGKNSKLIRFEMNTVQQILAQHVARCWHKKVPVRVALPKSRQQGSSTFWQLLFFALAELRPGYRVAVAAHDETGSREVFSRAFTALRQIRKRGDWPEPVLLAEQQGLLEWESESRMTSGTIKTGDAFGKGGTPSAIHYSESASFSDKGLDAHKAVNSADNAVPDHDPWTIIVHESTAKGKDPFFWPLCERARDINSGSSYTLIFLPWFLTPEYSISWASYRKRLMASGKPDPGNKFIPTPEEEELRTKLENVRVRKGEELLRYRVSLTDQQLLWRRLMIADKCGGELDEFKRYYPSFYEEAFIASASCFFDEVTIDWYRNQSRPPEFTGVLHSTPTGAMFQRNTSGHVQVWELPDPGQDYVVSGDPGGEKRNSDPYCSYVINKSSLQVVAMIHGNFEWDFFADQLYLLGHFYNEALLVVENNHRPAIAKRLHRLKYPNLHYYFDQDQRKNPTLGQTPGFNLNTKTRTAVLDALKRACRKRTLTLPDPEFWREMQDFVWVPKASAKNPQPGGDGQYRATGGNHDDRIIAAGLALVLCPQPEPTLSYEPPPPQRHYGLEMLAKFKREDELSARGGFLSLGA